MDEGVRSEREGSQGTEDMRELLGRLKEVPEGMFSAQMVIGESRLTTTSPAARYSAGESFPCRYWTHAGNARGL